MPGTIPSAHISYLPFSTTNQVLIMISILYRSIDKLYDMIKARVSSELSS